MLLQIPAAEAAAAGSGSGPEFALHLSSSIAAALLQQQQQGARLLEGAVPGQFEGARAA